MENGLPFLVEVCFPAFPLHRFLLEETNLSLPKRNECQGKDVLPNFFARDNISVNNQENMKKYSESMVLLITKKSVTLIFQKSKSKER